MSLWANFDDGRVLPTSLGNGHWIKQCKEKDMYIKTDLDIVGTVRSPIQCEGIDRGPKRIADVAASGSVGPQNFLSTLGHIAGALAPALPAIFGAI